jgi:ESCRT-II complex subunit VPS36
MPPSSAVGVSAILQRQQARTEATGRSMDTAFRDLNALMAAAQEMVALAVRFRAVSDGEEGVGGGGGESGGGGGPSSSSSSSGQQALVIDRETQLQLIALGIASPVTRESAGARYTLELARQLGDFLLTPVVGGGGGSGGGRGASAAAAAAATTAQQQDSSGLLSRAGGVMLLHDVYCLFNRARGVELVSPEDLIAACEAFGRAGGEDAAGGGLASAAAAAASASAAPAAPASSLPIRLRRLPSGVLVLQSTAFSDEELCRRIQELVDFEVEVEEEDQEGEEDGRRRPQQRQQRRRVAPGALGPPLFEADAARALRLPLALAREALRVAEQRGVLCRDEGGAEGLAFYRNFFLEA